MSRTGKIARLGHGTRCWLNERLRDGEGGAELLEELNALPPVKKVVSDHFGGVAISAQNLSEWRQGGYAEWLRQQEAVEVAKQFAEQALDLEVGTDESKVVEDLAFVLTAELAKSTKAMLALTDDPRERWQRLRELFPMLNQIRRVDLRAERLRYELDELEEEQEQRDLRRARRELAMEAFAKPPPPPVGGSLSDGAG